MNIKRKLIIFIIFIFISSINLLYGDYFFIPKKDLEKLGVHYKRLSPINISYRGDYFVGAEFIEDLQTRAKGFVWELKIIRFKDKKLFKVDSIQLPITHWVNAAISDKKDEMYVVGNYGTKILKVDLKNLKVKVAWEHKKGRGGFKGGDMIICYNGKFYAIGWFYDRNQMWKGDYLVQYIWKKKRKKRKFIFRKKINLDKLFSGPHGFVKSFYYISGNKVLYSFVNLKEKLTYLYYYRSGRRIIIDKGYMLLVFIGTNRKVYYNVYYKKGDKMKHFVKDIITQKRWKIGRDGQLLTYPFFSKDGKRLIVITLNRRFKKMSAFYGLEKDNYRLVKFLHRVEVGPMKITPDGNTYLVMMPSGIRVGYFNK